MKTTKKTKVVIGIVLATLCIAPAKMLLAQGPYEWSTCYWPGSPDSCVIAVQNEPEYDPCEAPDGCTVATPPTTQSYCVYWSQDTWCPDGHKGILLGQLWYVGTCGGGACTCQYDPNNGKQSDPITLCP